MIKHISAIKIVLVYGLYFYYFAHDFTVEEFRRGPNLRSCDPPRSVLVTRFSPENGLQLPVISGNIHVKLAVSGVGRFQK